MTTILLILILVFMLAGGFFGACETIILSASKARLQQRLTENDKSAVRPVKLMEKLEMVLGTTLLGTNLMMVTATTLASWLIADILTRKGISNEWESILNMVVMTPFILLISELTPKAIGRLHADRLISWTAPILYFFQLLLYPIVLTTSRFGRGCARLFGGSADQLQNRVTREDLQAMAIAAAEHGIVDEAAATMIRTVFELSRRPLSSVMVPLVDVVALPENSSLGELVECAAKTGFTRFPVYRQRIDEIIGIVSLRQVIYGLGEEWQSKPEQTLQKPLAPFIDKNLFLVPETKSVDSLLHDLRYREQPMAIMVDEHGGITGIATTEDLVEELVGEILDERDHEAGKLTIINEDVFDCDGKLEIRELSTRLNLEVSNDGFETIAGLVLKLAGRIPRQGERFNYREYEIEVLEVTARRIDKLRFRRKLK